MAKELAKFETAYKKLEADIKKQSTGEIAKAKDRIRLAYANCSEGENFIVESMVPARKNGVTGSGLADFLKDKSFKEAVGLYNKAVGDLVDEIKIMSDLSDGAKKTRLALAGILKDIEADLKKRSALSSSKKEIKSLQDKIGKDIDDLKKAEKGLDEVPKNRKDYPSGVKKTLGDLVKTAPEEAERQKDETELPQQMQDRVLQRNMNACLVAAKEVKTLVSDAIDKAAEDMKAAAPLLKKAGEELSKIKGHKDTYDKVVKKFQASIDNSKDKAKITKQIDTIQKAYIASERAVRGAVTTIRKANG